MTDLNMKCKTMKLEDNIRENLDAFPWWLVKLSTSCTCWPFVCFLWRNFHSSPLPFFSSFFWLRSCRSSLHILGMSLLDIWFANIFSLFIPLIISFVVHKCFSSSLIRSHLSIFTFVASEFSAIPKKSLLRQPWYCKIISVQLN